MVHIPENSKNTLVPYSAYNFLVRTSQTIHTPLFLQTVNSTVLNHMYPAIKTPNYPLPLHTLNTLSQGKPPTHSVTPLCWCWGLVLKCYELRTRQHKMLNINVLRPLKHYFPKDLMNFGRRLK
jgi:hypothetical protein